MTRRIRRPDKPAIRYILEGFALGAALAVAAFLAGVI